MHFLRKFQLIIWKNFIIRRRHYILTPCELVIPFLLFLLMAYIRGQVGAIGKQYVNSTTYSPIRTMDAMSEHISPHLRLLYEPNTPFYSNLMERSRQMLRVVPHNVMGYANEEQLMYNFSQMSLEDKDNEFNAILILFNDSKSTAQPKKLKYTLRTDSESISQAMDTESLFPPFMLPGPMYSARLYFDSGFIPVQTAIDRSFIDMTTKRNLSSLYELSLQEFPYPPYIQDNGFTELYKIILPLITIFSFLFLCPSVLKRIVEEKSTGIKELMKLMGLEAWMLWIGWLFHALTTNLISITIIILLLKIPWPNSEVASEAVIPLCNGFLLWLLLVLYCIAGICFCFFISTLFNRPMIAMSVGEVVWILSYFIPINFAQDSKQHLFKKMLLALFPNTAIYFGYETIATFEGRGDKGLQWSNLFEIPSGNPNDFSMALIYFMLIVDIAFYSILTWYIDNVKPGKYGLARPWYFPFTLSYWFSTKVDNSHYDSSYNSMAKNNCEDPSSHLQVGIRIKSLRKNYGATRAVDGLSMNIYKGEITALLGHNGAGKTTTMSIMTGMYAPTSGDVEIHDLSIRTQLNQVRDMLGLCPQHNMLFTDLTVFEHLIFFARLKGADNQTARREANNLLNLLKLSSKSNNMTETLSGGMKRKLSLAIALVGDAKFLMLDEPTSGMDPEARREVWDLLLRLRSPDKVILITTHFMEEADVLGDRIAIMDHGQLQCYGTSMFLKKRYGAGYQLSLMRNNETDVAKIEQIVTTHVPGSHLKNANAGLVTFTLPTQESGKFAQLFQILETSKAELHITGIGMSVTTLEEVFLRVGEIADSEYSDIHKRSMFGEDCLDGSDEKLVVNTERIKGIALEFDRFLVLIHKKYLFTIRKWILFGLMCILPILLICGTIILGQTKKDINSINPPLEINLKKYGYSEVYYSKPKSADLIQLTGYYNRSLPLETKSQAVPNVGSRLVDIGIENIARYRQVLLVAAEFNDSKPIAPQAKLNAMFSSIALHAAPISWNLLTNALVKTVMNSNEYSITTVNHPVEKSTENAINAMEELQNIEIIMLWLSLVPFGLLFLVGSFINFPLVERVSKAKQLQLMTGLRPYLYWLATYVWDMAMYFLVVVVMLALVAILDQRGLFNGIDALGTLFGILILYGFSAILYSYFVSFLRNTVPGAFSFLMITNIIIGFIATTTIYAMLYTKDATWLRVGGILKNLFSLIPHFAMSFSLLKFAKNAVDNNKCRIMRPEVRDFICETSAMDNNCCKLNCPQGKPCTEGFSYLTGDNGVESQLLMLFLDIFIYITLILLIEHNIFTFAYEHIRKLIFKTQVQQRKKDSDVESEFKRVNEYLKMNNSDIAEEDNLLVHDLMKAYNRKTVAVRGISFGVHNGECFGLLGVNGAGKTTTFKMLTGDEIPTRGDAIANHYRLSTNKTMFLAQLGYCPQFDAINEILTGKEMLLLFARLRGVNKIKINYEVAKWIELLGLKDYTNRQCGTYSGGNKRKLSTAMALIGDSSIVLLDEPTSGVDPISRRNLWNVLSNIKKQSVILTSHSMEECEALCNRLAIMVNGQFVCVGTVQYLKQRFGQGYTIVLKIRSGVNDTQVNSLKQRMENEFECEIKDEHEGLLHYHVIDVKTTWFDLFSKMDKMKTQGGLIEDYTISETTLEQVFLSFARDQRDVSFNLTEEINGQGTPV